MTTWRDQISRKAARRKGGPWWLQPLKISFIKPCHTLQGFPRSFTNLYRWLALILLRVDIFVMYPRSLGSNVLRVHCHYSYLFPRWRWFGCVHEMYFGPLDVHYYTYAVIATTSKKQVLLWVSWVHLLGLVHPHTGSLMWWFSFPSGMSNSSVRWMDLSGRYVCVYIYSGPLLKINNI